MASIKGLSVKKVVTFQGMDGQGTQCDVYYLGKKVGFYSDMGDGGEAQVDVTKEVVEIFRDYEVRDPEYHFKGVEWTILDVLELSDYAKAFKSKVKKGFNALIVVKNSYQTYTVGVRMKPTDSEQAMIALLKDNYKVQFGTLPDSAFTVYRTLADFEQGA